MAASPPRSATILHVKIPNAPKRSIRVRRTPFPEGFRAQVKLFQEDRPSLFVLQTISNLFASAFGANYPVLFFRLDNLTLASCTMLTFLNQHGRLQMNLLRTHFPMLKIIFAAYEVPVNDSLNSLADLIFKNL